MRAALMGVDVSSFIHHTFHWLFSSIAAILCVRLYLVAFLATKTRHYYLRNRALELSRHQELVDAYALNYSN